MRGRRAVKRASGDLFGDLGFAPAEAQNLRIRAELMVQVERIMQRRRLTQAEAARVFGVTQPRISNLVRGRIDLFSIDALVTMLARAGARVSLDVRAA
jgi:predicted XRE-type DNA-binding protein